MEKAHELPSLSGGLVAIIRAIEPTRKTGLVMTRPNVATFLDGLEALLDEARHLETIADRAQWNERARKDAIRGRQKELADAVADGTVTVFPVAPRPTAIHQGDQGGAA